MKRKIPRGKGYDKAAVLGHLRKMAKDGIFVTGYVKQAGLKLDTFMLALQDYADPKWIESTRKWVSHPLTSGDPKLITEICQQCSDPYWPTKQGTKFCSSYCGGLYRKDQEYFGGRRNETVGLKEAVCQLCGRLVERGLSSHHIYGKQNDVANEFLLALCKGCHQIVSDLALKTWCGDDVKLAKLIWLAYTQRNGAEMLRLRKDEFRGWVVEVSFQAALYETS